jgi:hypothetical protein
MKTLIAFLALASAAVAQSVPTPAQLQQLSNALSALQTDDATYQTQAATVATDSAAVTAAQATLATDTATAQATAAQVQTDVAAVIQYAQALQASTSAAAGFGPGPHVGPGPGPMPFNHGGPDIHGGGFGPRPDFYRGGGYQPYVNPFNIVGPVIDYGLRGPRLMQNPITGQMEYMSPGSWVQVNVGTPAQSWAWVASPTGTWLTASTQPRVDTSPIPKIPELPHPIKRIKGLFGRIFHRR